MKPFSFRIILESGEVLNQADTTLVKVLEKKLPIAEFLLIRPEYMLRCTGCAGVKQYPEEVVYRVLLDKNKSLIVKRRPPTPSLTLVEGEPFQSDGGSTVWVVGWQQELVRFRDANHRHPCIQSVSVINETTGQVTVLDRFMIDVELGSHGPQLSELEKETWGEGRPDPFDPTQSVPVLSSTELEG